MGEKRILVTGASSGIGLATVQLLQNEGLEVLAMSRRYTEDLKNLGVKHYAVDLRNPNEIEQAFKNIGIIDGLVNNAGIAYMSPVTEGNLCAWDEMWEVNVRALAYTSSLSIKAFPEPGGQIINISSMSGHRVPPSGGFYSSTKFAVKALTEALRLELKSAGNPTRISTVSPGFVETPLLDIYFQGRENELETTKNSMAMLSAENIAQQILHILKTPLSVEIGDISLKSSGQLV